MCDDVNVLPAWALEMMKRRRSYTASNPVEAVSSPLPFVDGGRTVVGQTWGECAYAEN